MNLRTQYNQAKALHIVPFLMLCRFTALAALFNLAGCASVSGIGGNSSLSCPLEKTGGTCQSIRTTHAQVSGEQPISQAMMVVPDASSPAIQNTLQIWNDSKRQEYQSHLVRVTPTSGTPIRTQSNVLRVWIAPYEDDEGVLRDQAYTYMALDNARWLIDHNQKRIMNDYAPVTGPETIKSNSANQSNESSAQTNSFGSAEMREQAKQSALQVANDAMNLVVPKLNSLNDPQ